MPETMRNENKLNVREHQTEINRVKHMKWILDRRIEALNVMQ